MKVNEKYIVVTLSILIMVFSIHIGTTVFKRIQLDATDENIYTLSEGSKLLLKKVTTPIRLKLYYSKTAANKGSEGIRAFNSYFQYINDLLSQYVASANNNISLEVIDPRPDTRDEEDALAFGLKKFNLTETETYFFGLVVETSTGTEKVLEFFNPNDRNRVEYDITKLIYQATNPKKQRIGVISPLEVIKKDLSPYMAQLMRFQGRKVEESWHSIKALKEFYDVVKVEDDGKAIEGIDVLIVIHPHDFSEQTLFNIDQFVMKGGKLMVLVDPFALSAQNIEDENDKPTTQSSFSLMEKWGIAFDPSKFVGDKYIAGNARIAPNMPPMKTLPLILCRNVCYENLKDTISSSLGITSFVFTGGLEKKDVEGVSLSSIVQTTEKGNYFKATERDFQRPDGMWNRFIEGSSPVTLAMKAVGKFKTNFPDGVTVEVDDEKIKGKKIKKKLEAIKESTQESVIIAFADVDFINDPYAFHQSLTGFSPSNDNSILFLNSIETLSGSTDLLAVRSRDNIDRTFDVITNIEMEAAKKTEDKVKQINEQISKAQQELNALGKQANEQNIALIQNEGLRKKKELSKRVAILKRELRDVKREGRERVERLGQILQAINTLLIPIIILFFGLYVNYKRRKLA